jgi:hypothetical protein
LETRTIGEAGMTPDGAQDRSRTEQRPDPAEPPTPRALWPTFMRRTLEEDALRAEQREVAPAK